MGFIYKITNLLNQHCYIGQTSRDYKTRWEEHKKEAYEGSSLGYNFILHKAFRKYGIENFSFELLEECENSLLQDKEKYWISFYKSFSGDGFGGYNMTRGGEGNLLIPYEAVYKLWNEGYTTTQIGQILGHDRSAIREILKGYDNYSVEEGIKRGRELQHGTNFKTHPKKEKKEKEKEKEKNFVVLQYSIYGDFIAEYPNRLEAERNTGVSAKNIWAAIKNKNNKTAGGFQWVYKGEFIPQDISKEQLNTKYKQKVVQYSIEGEVLNEYESAAEAARQTNINSGTIRGVCQGKRKTAGGYIWRYKEGD